MIADSNVGLRLDSNQIGSDLKKSIINLCKRSLPLKKQLLIDGVIGVTVDSEKIFLLSIKDVVGVQRDECDDGLSSNAPSPNVHCAQEDNSVMDLCVKSSAITPQQTELNISEASSRACSEQDTHNAYSISSLDSNADTKNSSQKLSCTSTSDGDGVKMEVQRSDSINSCGSRKRSRKSKTTRHISKQLVYSAQSPSDDDALPTHEDSRSSQEMTTPEMHHADGDDEPVNLSASSRCASQASADVKANNNVESRGGDLFGATATNNLHALAAMSMLNNLPGMHAEAPLASLNPLLALSEHHQQQQAQWLNSIAAQLLPGMQAPQTPLNQHLPLIAPADVTLNKSSPALESLAKASAASAANNPSSRPPGPLKVCLFCFPV